MFLLGGSGFANGNEAGILTFAFIRLIADVSNALTSRRTSMSLVVLT